MFRPQVSGCRIGIKDTPSALGLRQSWMYSGTAKPISVTGISIAGADAGNYNLLNTTASTSATRCAGRTRRRAFSG